MEFELVLGIRLSLLPLGWEFPAMYEVHPDDKGQWVLYETGDGGFDAVAWFADREDAEFTRGAFERRDAERLRPASANDTLSPDHVTAAPA